MGKTTRIYVKPEFIEELNFDYPETFKNIYRYSKYQTIVPYKKNVKHEKTKRNSSSPVRK